MDRVQYTLNLVAEEGTEIAQAAAKALRFGLFDTDPKKGITNLQALVGELNDLRGVLNLLVEELESLGIKVDGLDDQAAIEAKEAKVLKWSARSIANGTLREELQDLTIVRLLEALKQTSAGTTENG